MRKSIFFVKNVKKGDRQNNINMNTAGDMERDMVPGDLFFVILLSVKSFSLCCRPDAEFPGFIRLFHICNSEVINVAKSSVVTTKIDAGLKEDVTVIFKRLGFSATEAITFYSQR
jgi:hypothetical protein